MRKEAPADWTSVEGILQTALEKPVAERHSFIGRASKKNERLRLELLELLQASEAAARSGFLSRSAADLLESAESEVLAPSADHLGAYRIVRELGRGGMGVVYLAERADGEFQHQVAIKSVRRGLASSSAHFSRERQILAQLEHPNVARLLGGGSDENGRPYFIMEYVAGEPIDRYCDALRLDVSQRLRLFLQVCSAVQFAHQNAVVHGDLKPRNLLVTGDGAVKLLDFGTAHILESHVRGERSLSADRSRALTLPYASPEQLFGRPVNVASDVFSLGAVLHTLLVGVTPRSGAESEPLVFRQMAEANPPSSTFSSLGRSANDNSDPSMEDIALRRGLGAKALERGLRGDLDAILLKALRSDPRQRYLSVEQFAGDLERYLEGRPVSARRATARYRTAKLIRRNPVSTFLTAALTLFLVGSALVLALQTYRLHGEMKVAEQERAKAEHISDFLVEIFQLASSGAQFPTEELLLRGAERARQEFAERPQELASALTALGAAYRSMARYGDAHDLLREGLELRMAHVGPDHPDTASSLQELGRLHWARLELDEAESLLKDTLRIRQRHSGAESPGVASALLSLSAVQGSRGNLSEAEELARRSLEIRRRVFGDEHEDTASSLHNVAAIRNSRGIKDGVEQLMLDVLGTRQRILGPSHPDVGAALNNLGSFYLGNGRLREAQVRFSEAVDIYRGAWGPSHPNLAATLRNLADAHAGLAEFRLAEPMAREMLRILTDIYGEDHLVVAIGWHELALLKLRQGELREAAPLFEKTIGLAGGAGGPNHEYVACSTQHLGEIAHLEGALGEARRLFDRALAMWRDTVGLENRYAAATLSAKAKLLLDSGRTEEGQAMLERALEIRTAVLGKEHPDVADSLHDIAGVELASGNLPRARRLCGEALGIRRASLGVDHPGTAATAGLCRQVQAATGL